jgi:hypothetical protein
MRPDRISRWGLRFVLAALCLRALVPAGYMLTPIEGRLAIVLCDAAATGAHHHHHAGDHPNRGHDHTHPDPTCPFAQSAAPAPLPALPVLASRPLATLLRAATDLPQTNAPFGPDRQQSPRGPPHVT